MSLGIIEINPLYNSSFGGVKNGSSIFARISLQEWPATGFYLKFGYSSRITLQYIYIYIHTHTYIYIYNARTL